jgi:hypothetical protein
MTEPIRRDVIGVAAAGTGGRGLLSTAVNDRHRRARSAAVRACRRDSAASSGADRASVTRAAVAA